MKRGAVDTYLTSREVAVLLNVQPQTLDAWASQGRGPDYYKVEGVRRYSQADLQAWLAQRKVRHG